MKISVLFALCMFISSYAQHAGFKLENIRPPFWNWAIGSMAFFPNGDLLVASWKDPYEVHIVKNVQSGDPSKMTMTVFASGLREMLGVKVVDDTVFVLQKDELTQLLDHDGDGKADEFRPVTMDWSRTTNEKNYAFGLAYNPVKKTFYAAFNGDLVRGASLRSPQPPGRHNAVYEISRSGEINLFAGGLRVPSGVGFAFGEVWITENQGGYRPGDPLINARQDRWYGRQAVKDPLPFMQPYPKQNESTPGTYDAHAFTFPHKILMRSPGTPMALESGPYKGHMLVPDACNGPEEGASGIRRVFLETTLSLLVSLSQCVYVSLCVCLSVVCLFLVSV